MFSSALEGVCGSRRMRSSTPPVRIVTSYSLRASDDFPILRFFLPVNFTHPEPQPQAYSMTICSEGGESANALEATGSVAMRSVGPQPPNEKSAKRLRLSIAAATINGRKKAKNWNESSAFQSE